LVLALWAAFAFAILQMQSGYRFAIPG